MESTEHIAMNCICGNLRAAARKITRKYADVLQPSGINPNQFSILIAVELLQPVSISMLAEGLHMDRTTLTRNLRPLEKDALVMMESGGGRTRLVSLSEKGRQKMTHAKVLWEVAQDEMKEVFNESELLEMPHTLRSLKSINV
jgi:DNA-binding MarR family transcriptional regulator